MIWGETLKHPYFWKHPNRSKWKKGSTSNKSWKGRMLHACQVRILSKMLHKLPLPKNPHPHYLKSLRTLGIIGPKFEGFDPARVPGLQSGLDGLRFFGGTCYSINYLHIHIMYVIFKIFIYIYMYMYISTRFFFTYIHIHMYTVYTCFFWLYLHNIHIYTCNPICSIYRPHICFFILRRNVASTWPNGFKVLLIKASSVPMFHGGDMGSALTWIMDGLLKVSHPNCWRFLTRSVEGFSPKLLKVSHPNCWHQSNYH